MPKPKNDPILEVKDLNVHFSAGKKLLSREQSYVYAVNGVNISLFPGETLGIVGESGCGKTTTGMALLDLVKPTSGRIRFKGQDISNRSALTKEARLKLRQEMQIIFQDPYSSLNPRSSLRKILDIPMKLHGWSDPGKRRERTEYLMEKVGLPKEHLGRFPHQFSGGQRQRIGIARALSVNPSLIIGDEPVSALDVSIQAQILNLLMDLQEEFNLSFIFISHDLGVIEHVSDRVMVMYLGRIVESADFNAIYTKPMHPYTEALLSAVPKADPRSKSRRILLKGDVPSPRRPPSGCPFHPRCPKKRTGCEKIIPALKEVNDRHEVACLLY